MAIEAKSCRFAPAGDPREMQRDPTHFGEWSKSTREESTEVGAGSIVLAIVALLLALTVYAA